MVTGGASGLGLAFAQALKSRGATAWILDLDADTLEVSKRPGLRGRVCDVRDGGALASAAEATGPVDLLIVNAGVAVAGRFRQVPEEDVNWVLDINLRGAMSTVRTFLPRLSRGSHIVLVSSSFGWMGCPGKSAYSASKAGLRAFGEALRAELAHEGIGVTLLFPGPVDTGLIRNGRAVDLKQRSAEAAFVARRAVPAARVVDRCLSGVARNAPRVVVSTDYILMDLAARLAPVWTLRCVAWLAHRLPL